MNFKYHFAQWWAGKRFLISDLILDLSFLVVGLTSMGVIAWLAYNIMWL